jgi:hypothetical protein
MTAPITEAINIEMLNTKTNTWIPAHVSDLKVGVQFRATANPSTVLEVTSNTVTGLNGSGETFVLVGIPVTVVST